MRSRLRRFQACHTVTSISPFPPPFSPSVSAGDSLPQPLLPHPAPVFAHLWRHAGRSWPRDRTALTLLGLSGWSSRLALNAWLVAHDAGLTPAEDGAARRLWDRMEARGLIVQRTVVIDPPRRHSIALLWPSELGRTFLFEQGLPYLRLSEWDRLRLRHNGADQPVHSAMVIAAAHQFRRRGLLTEVCPPPEHGFAPDLRLEDGVGRRLYVEVEAPAHGGQAQRRRLLRKWELLLELQGRVAVCALNPRSCHRHVSLAGKVAPCGLATDLYSLSQDEEATVVWTDVWGDGAWPPLSSPPPLARQGVYSGVD